MSDNIFRVNTFYSLSLSLNLLIFMLNLLSGMSGLQLAVWCCTTWINYDSTSVEQLSTLGINVSALFADWSSNSLHVASCNRHTYSTKRMYSLRSRKKAPPLPPTTLDTLHSLGILHYRGSRGGRFRQRAISVVTSRPRAHNSHCLLNDHWRSKSISHRYTSPATTPLEPVNARPTDSVPSARPSPLPNLLVIPRQQYRPLQTTPPNQVQFESPVTTDSLLDFIEQSVKELSITNDLIILEGDLNTLLPYRITELTGLIDIVHAPTRGASCLDHILLSDNYQYDSIKVIKWISNSDHDAIVAYCGPPIINQFKQRKTHTDRPSSPSDIASYLSHLPSVHPANFLPLCTSDPQAAFDHFYTFLSDRLNKFFPLKTVIDTSSDLDFVTPEIKTALHRINHLMHQGKTEEANALACKIGSLITKHNSRSLVYMKYGEEAADLSSMVKKVTGKKISSTILSDITAH